MQFSDARRDRLCLKNTSKLRAPMARHPVITVDSAVLVKVHCTICTLGADVVFFHICTDAVQRNSALMWFSAARSATQFSEKCSERLKNTSADEELVRCGAVFDFLLYWCTFATTALEPLRLNASDRFQLGYI